jgi:hypothetical protein
MLQCWIIRRHCIIEVLLPKRVLRGIIGQRSAVGMINPFLLAKYLSYFSSLRDHRIAKALQLEIASWHPSAAVSAVKHYLIG